MKLAIASEHRDFFNKNGYIEFAEILTEGQTEKLLHDIRQALVNRQKLVSHATLEKIPTDILFAQGRDLWRELPAIRKALFNPALAEIAYEFCQERPLRIGYDQYLPANPAMSLAANKPAYGQLLAGSASLAEVSSIQGLNSGLLLCLKGSESAQGIFPSTAGHGVYLSAVHPIDFSLKPADAEYLLLTYAIKKSVYILNERDPLGHTFKGWGYTFGDALSDKLNPVILR